MHRIALGIGLAVWAGLSGNTFAGAPPHLTGPNLIQLADGTRIELSTSFRVDLDAGADGTITALNRGAIEVTVKDPPPDNDRPGASSPLPGDRLFVSGEFLGGPGSIDPCWMPAL